jgi:hypothetical protein
LAFVEAIVPEVTAETVRSAADQIWRRLLAAYDDADVARASHREALRDNNIMAAEKFAADLAFSEGTASACTIAIVEIERATGVVPTVL